MRDLSRFVVPLTVNIHTIGLAINIPLLALYILLNFANSLPSFSTYLEFAAYFVLAQFSVAAVPGCGVLLMIPLLETYLGFTNEMSALLIVIYVLFDPLETSANVLGNSIIIILLSQIKNKFFYKNYEIS